MAASASQGPADYLLSEAIQRQLFDKSEAKRREASAAVHSKVRELLKRGAEAEIRGLLQSLSTTMIDGTTDAAVRTGGLLGISAAGTALGSSVRGFLDEIVGAVMAGMDDDREPVRFAACEAIFNVAKVARAALLRPDLFRLIFVGMLNVAGDSAEGDVRGGAWMLSTALLEIATSQGDAFELPVFLDLFASYGTAHNPHTRQVLLAWLLQLDLVPGIDVADHLPHFLAPLLHMLQDPNGEVRGEAHRVLAHFLKQVQSLEAGQLATRVDLAALVAILTENSAAAHEFIRMMVFDWLVAIVRCAGSSLSTFFPSLTGAILRGVSDEHQTVMTTAMVVNQELTRLVRHTEGEMPFDDVAAQVLTALQSGQPLTRRTALAWVSMLLDRDATAMMRLNSEFLAQLLDNITAECDDDELSLHIQVLALMSRSETHEPGADAADAVLFGDRVLAEVLELLRDGANSLLERRGAYVLRHLCVVMDPERVYRVMARQLWMIETGRERVDSESTECKPSEAAASGAAATEPASSATASSAAAAPVSSAAAAPVSSAAAPPVSSQPEAAPSDSIGDAESAEFAYVVVEMLSLVLMTAPELAPLRARLQPSIRAGIVPTVAEFAKPTGDHSPEAAGEVFAELFRTWSCNPISSLLLAFMAEQYEIANGIVKSLAAEPITVATLMQLDRGVQLLESPCFIQLRLHLCDPAHPGHAHLLSALYGVLMVLPQSTAFHTLRDRLTSVTSLHIGLAMTAQIASGSLAPPAASAALSASAAIAVDPVAMLSVFTDAQRRRSVRTVAGDAEGAIRDGALPGWESLGGPESEKQGNLAPLAPAQLGQLTGAAKQASAAGAGSHAPV